MRGPKIKWSILIASALSRSGMLDMLLAELRYQKKEYPDVDIIVLVDDCVMPLDAKRNMLVSMATGDYVSFIDDDDSVASDYIASIYPLLDGVDYIGFQLQHYNKGIASKPTYHSLQYKGWSESDDGYYRGISHLNPIRHSIAQRFGFEGSYAEDASWAKRIEQSGLAQTEHYINKIMYFYYFDIDRSLTAGK
jgi:hypothetical protein